MQRYNKEQVIPQLKSGTSVVEKNTKESRKKIMGLEGKDLVKRDLKRKVKGLVIPHKIDFSNKKIKR